MAVLVRDDWAAGPHTCLVRLEQQLRTQHGPWHGSWPSNLNNVHRARVPRTVFSVCIGGASVCLRMHTHACCTRCTVNAGCRLGGDVAR